MCRPQAPGGTFSDLIPRVRPIFAISSTGTIVAATPTARALREGDSASRIIVATTVRDNASDAVQLKPTLDAARDNLGVDPKRILADAGHQSESNLEMLEQTAIDGHGASGREKDLDQAGLP